MDVRLDLIAIKQDARYLCDQLLTSVDCASFKSTEIYASSAALAESNFLNMPFHSPICSNIKIKKEQSKSLENLDIIIKENETISKILGIKIFNAYSKSKIFTIHPIHPLITICSDNYITTIYYNPKKDSSLNNNNNVVNDSNNNVVNDSNNNVVNDSRKIKKVPLVISRFKNIPFEKIKTCFISPDNSNCYIYDEILLQLFIYDIKYEYGKCVFIEKYYITTSLYNAFFLNFPNETFFYFNNVKKEIKYIGNGNVNGKILKITDFQDVYPRPETNDFLVLKNNTSIEIYKTINNNSEIFKYIDHSNINEYFIENTDSKILKWISENRFITAFVYLNKFYCRFWRVYEIDIFEIDIKLDEPIMFSENFQNLNNSILANNFLFVMKNDKKIFIYAYDDKISILNYTKNEKKILKSPSNITSIQYENNKIYYTNNNGYLIIINIDLT